MVSLIVDFESNPVVNLIAFSQKKQLEFFYIEAIFSIVANVSQAGERPTFHEIVLPKIKLNL